MLGHLEADRARVAELEAQILDLKRPIAELRTEKAIVQERLDSYKYPVLTLPDELMSEIFDHFLPNYPNCPPLVGALANHFDPHLSRTASNGSSHTRALESHRLSSCYYCAKPRPPFFQIRGDAWVSSSGSCPLSISIMLGMPYILPIILSTIVPHRVRWEHLKLDISTDPAFFFICSMAQCFCSDISTCQWHFLITSRSDCAPLICRGSAQSTASTLTHCALDFLWGRFRFTGDDITLLCLETLVLSGGDGIAGDLLANLSAPALLRLEFEEGSLGTNDVGLLEAFTFMTVKLQEIKITECTTHRTFKGSENGSRTVLHRIPTFFFRR
ncbi:F-box domain-containing protein [Mycena sanguinolenta]|uniref:F-box domain-containing protein n=1 Tax=Mycena sanguinolenta TaxID=230812 RepID=A0A8H7DCC7_9AGAR|nr:F-box domain-containing protein [Mycena sanguinolenta]